MQVVMYKIIRNGIAGLNQDHSRHRAHIMNLLDQGKSHMKSIADVMETKIRQFEVTRLQSLGPSRGDEKLEDYECRDVHMAPETGSDWLFKVCLIEALLV